MEEKSPFSIATDNTKQVLFRDGIRAFCDTALRNGVSDQVVADELLHQAISVMAGNLRMVRHWVPNAILRLQDFKQTHGEFVSGLKQKIEDIEAGVDESDKDK